MTIQKKKTAPAAGDSLTIPLLLAVAAPLAVIFGIEVLRSVWWTFALYQVGLCLVAPALESRLAGRSWRDHARLLGLVGRSGAGGSLGAGVPSATADSAGREHSPRRLALAVFLGLASALVTGGFLVTTRQRFLEPDRLEATVARWGVPPEQMLTMLAVMAVLNATAEELFWRGYFPGRVAAARPNSPPSVGLTVILPAALYASYHAATIGHLVGKTSGVVLMTGGVLAAGLFWGWLRLRTGSVWPPLLSHGGGVIAYLAVHFWLTSGTGS